MRSPKRPIEQRAWSRRLAAAPTVHAPCVLDGDVLSALLGLVRGREITEREADTALSSYRAFPAERHDGLPLWPRLKSRGSPERVSLQGRRACRQRCQALTSASALAPRAAALATHPRTNSQPVCASSTPESGVSRRAPRLGSTAAASTFPRCWPNRVTHRRRCFRSLGETVSILSSSIVS